MVGSKLWSLLKHLDAIVPDEQIDAAIDLVAKAAVKFVDNAARREWVVARLMERFPIPESLARFLVEIAVQNAKKELDKLADKAKEQL